MLNRIRRVIFLTVLAVLIILPTIHSMAQSDSPHDLLLYAAYNESEHGEITFMIYDPQTGESRSVITLPESNHQIAFSVDGQLAFQSIYEEEAHGISVLDVLSTDGEPIEISPYPLPRGTVINGNGRYPLIWSPDGRYLAFAALKGFGESVPYVWDGEFLFNIMPDDVDSIPSVGDLSWSSDGRLAFTVSGQLYLWDSQTAWSGQPAINLSRNGEYNVYSPVWSTNGRLAFKACHEGECDIFVWDGVSTDASLPDAPAFTNIAPDLTTFYSDPTWTPEGLLAFMSRISNRDHQIYAWDGQTVTNISQSPTTCCGLPSWGRDGYWAFEWKHQIYVRDADNNTVLTLDGIHPRWSLSGRYIAFLAPGDEWDLTVSIWDGEKVIPLAQQAGLIWLQWQGDSEYILCCYRG